MSNNARFWWAYFIGLLVGEANFGLCQNMLWAAVVLLVVQLICMAIYGETA